VLQDLGNEISIRNRVFNQRDSSDREDFAFDGIREVEEHIVADHRLGYDELGHAIVILG